MGYRDDREALHHRVAQLEEELAGAHREGEQQGRDAAEARAAELEQRIAAMRAELETMGAELRTLRGGSGTQPQRATLIAGAVGLVVFAGIMGALAWALKSPPSVPVAIPLPPPPEHLDPIPPAPAPEAPPPSPLPKPQARERSTSARWIAKVTRADGLPLAAGAACTVEATIATTETNALVKDFSVVCGAQKLYRSSDALNGMAQMRNDAREKLGPTDDRSTFTLAYRDIGTRTGERTQIDLDTNMHQGTVFRETLPRFRVDLSIPTTSAATTPLAGAEARLRRAGKITETTGAAAAKKGAACVLRAMPTGNDEDCVAEVACGPTILWPSSAPVKCTYDGARPSSVASEDAATTLSLDGPTLTVKTKAFGATIALDEP